jgi:hypothetical protein
MHCFLEKTLQSTTFWVNFKEIFFLLYCKVMDVDFGDFIFTKYFKIKLFDVSNKNLYSAFL